LPHIGVVLTAFSDTWIRTILPDHFTLRHIQFVLTQPETCSCIMNSLRYAGTATILDMIIGTLAAWIIVRKQPWGAKALDMLLMMPLAVPGIILAAGFIAMTVTGSALERIGPLGNPFWIIIIAYTVRRIPFIVRGVSAGLEQIPETLEQAACNLGATPTKAVLKITCPLIMANIIASSVLTFSFAMLEVSDSLMLAQLRKHYPITKEIYSQALSANTDALNIAAALGVIGMILLGGSLAAAGLLLGKKLGAIFRA
jgi:iron(III) transport system permease protein